MKPPRNPALKPLEFLIGTWQMVISNARFLPDPSAMVRGESRFKWIEGGDFLALRQGNRSKPPYATWIIGRDDTTKDYSVLYFDDRRVSRLYHMSFEAGEWRLWRDAPRFFQRFKGKVSRDRNTIRGSWEMSRDGSKWEHDFDLTYTRKMW